MTALKHPGTLECGELSGNQDTFSYHGEKMKTHHSSGRGKTVCLSALSGSYSNDTPAVGFHLACSLPKPFLA